MKRAGKGVFQMIPAGTIGKMESLGGEKFTQQEEHDLMVRVSKVSGRPVTFTLVQSPDYDPDTWREILSLTEDANSDGAQIYPQVSSRPIGFLTGLGGYHAFMRRPTYLREIAHLPLDQKVAMMSKPEVRAAIMSEKDVAPDEPGSMENVYGLFKMAAPALYPLDNPVDYEPDISECLGAKAAAIGVDPIDYLYDFLLEDGGTRFASLSAVDLPARMGVLQEMLLHPDTVTGLSDAGAHVTLICDGSMPTTQLAYWTRDREKGEKIPIEYIVRKQTALNAQLYGFDDRGALEQGKKADVNVIDMDNLRVSPPVSHHDLPTGGTRLMQPVTGYINTLCNGISVREFDLDTGDRPGRLVRS